jgi:gliding motility-associated-like protein
LTVPTLLGNSNSNADGTWSVNANGQVVFTPNAGLAPGIYHDTIYYQVCDLVDVPQLCATAYVAVTTDEIDTALIANRPPVAVNDHETVPETIPTSFNVKANDSDPDGNPLTIPTILVGPLHGTILSVGDNGTVIYQSDTNIHSSNSHTPVDSFEYQICDSQSVHPVSPLCSTAEVYIYVPQLLFAVNDTSLTGCHTPDTICVKDNDYDIEHNPFFVTGVVVQPLNGTAVLNPVTQCIVYTPNGSASNYTDSFRYAIKEPLYGATDSAWVFVHVVCCQIDAANDTFSLPYEDSIYAAVLANDIYNNSLPQTVTILAGSGPSNGIATVVGDSVKYVANRGFCGTDVFKYILSDLCGKDTAEVVINVICPNCNKPLATNDTISNGYVCIATIKVLAKDTFTAGASVTLVKPPLYGTDTVINNNIVYTPNGTHPNTVDTLTYSLCNPCGRCDTATVFIDLSGYPCNVGNPKLVNDTVTICRNKDTLVNVLLGAHDPGGFVITISAYTQGSHGSVSQRGDSLLYKPTTNYVGSDTFTYQACDSGTPSLCSTAFVYVNILPCAPPVIVIPDTIIRDTTVVCVAKQFCIDSIYQALGDSLTYIGLCGAPSNGTLTLLGSDTVSAQYGTLCFTYTPTCDTTVGNTPFTGNDTMCVIICSTGPVADTACITRQIVITILPKPPVDSIRANPDLSYICGSADTIYVLSNDAFGPQPGNNELGTAITVHAIGQSAGEAPLHGTVTFGPGDTTVIYTPDSAYVGIDSFKYVITKNGIVQIYDTATVTVYVCVPATPIAVNDNPSCLDTTGYVDQPAIINILGNDTLSRANDTLVVIVDSVLHGHLVINANYTVTYTPDSGFHGNDNFSYQVYEFIGSSIGKSDTATVCIDIIDTTGLCFFPNGFSPNGDGVNDYFVFPCNDKYPNASLQIFNRWGDAIWQSSGGYKNDWDGRNLKGNPVPDGTYYFIYAYNDGSGRTSARFVVVNR